MKLNSSMLISVFIVLPLFSISQIERPVGTNLRGVNDYSPEFVFVDCFKQARQWISHDAEGNGAWDTGVDIPLNEFGYPLEIPYDNGVDPPQQLRTLVVWGLEEHTPQGYYRLKVEGSGEIRLLFGASGYYQCPLDTLVYVTGNVAIEIEESLASDPISDIKFILPQYVDNYEGKTFTDEFLDFVDDFQVLRYMDWLRTNFSDNESWDERTGFYNYSQGLITGVAWEYIIELSNLTGKDAWICVPHLADDDYIQNLAKLFHDNLDTDISLYLEYSNEIWNGGFSQHREVGALGAQEGYDGEQWVQTWKYAMKRSADIFKAFEDEFEDDSRLIKIIPTQAAGTWLTNQYLEYYKDPLYNPYQIKADAIAIAPYFAGRVANEIVEEGLVSSITIQEIIERMQQSLSHSYENMMMNIKEIADENELRLIAYEGGQHLVGTGPNVNDTTLTRLIAEANRHPDMQNLYCQYFDYWYENVGDLFVHFSSHILPSRYGCWGVKEHMNDFDNPKYLGLQNCVFFYNSDNTAIDDQPPVNHSTLNVFPNPSKNGMFRVDCINEKIKLARLIDMNGKEIPSRTISISDHSIDVFVEKSGAFFLIIETDNNQYSYKLLRL